MILSFKPEKIGGGDCSGVALLLVLAVISILMAAALELARTTGAFALTTGRAADRLQAREQAEAGIQLSLAILTEDAQNTDLDSVQEDWADAEKLAEMVAGLGYPDQGLGLEIWDELGKLQVNGLLKEYPGREMNPDQYRIWENFIAAGTGKAGTADAPGDMINSMLDWLDDRDDEAVTGLSGAESDYYCSLDIPYQCANGPFNHVSELFLVKGMVPELFARARDQEPGRESGTDGAEGQKTGIGELVTVYGLDVKAASQGRFRFPARINVNTAREPVLRALLPGELSDAAGDLCAYRLETAGKGAAYVHNLDKGWVNRVIHLSDKEKQVFNRSIRYDSFLFRVIASARVNSVRVILSAVIVREQDDDSGQWHCRIIQLEER